MFRRPPRSRPRPDNWWPAIRRLTATVTATADTVAATAGAVACCASTGSWLAGMPRGTTGTTGRDTETATDPDMAAVVPTATASATRNIPRLPRVIQTS